MRLLTVVVLLLMCLSACVQTQATMLGSTRFDPVPVDSVEIYLSEEDIQFTYTKIALINAQGESSMTNEKSMYEAVRKRAAQIGANGIIVGAINEPGSGAKVAAAVLGVSTTRRGQMLAVRVDKSKPKILDVPKN